MYSYYILFFKNSTTKKKTYKNFTLFVFSNLREHQKAGHLKDF